MLETLLCVLLILWILGMVAIGTQVVHVLLVCALVVLLIRLLR